MHSLEYEDSSRRTFVNSFSPNGSSFHIEMADKLNGSFVWNTRLLMQLHQAYMKFPLVLYVLDSIWRKNPLILIGIIIYCRSYFF